MVAVKWPNLNRLYVHPLMPVAGFVTHTALTVLFAVYVAPTIAASAGISVALAALLWLVLGLVMLGIALVRQSQMEGSVIAE